MTTLTTIIYLLALVALIISSYQIAFSFFSSPDSNGKTHIADEKFDDFSLLVVLLITGTMILSIVFGWAISVDLYGVGWATPPDMVGGVPIVKRVLLSGLVILGISSVSSLFVRWWQQDGSFEGIPSVNGAGLVEFIIWVISLLASILGILSFYLDYLM